MAGQMDIGSDRPLPYISSKAGCGGRLIAVVRNQASKEWLRRGSAMDGRVSRLTAEETVS